MKRWKILLFLLIVVIASTIFWFYFNSTRAERHLAERIPTKVINIEVNLTKALKLRSWFKGDTTKGFEFIRNFKPNPLVKAHVFGNDSSAIFVAFENAVDVDAQKIKTALKKHPRWHFTHEGKSCLLGRASEADFDSVKVHFLTPALHQVDSTSEFEGVALININKAGLPLMIEGSRMEVEVSGDTLWINRHLYEPKPMVPFSMIFLDTTVTNYLRQFNKKKQWVADTYKTPVRCVAFQIRDTMVTEQTAITYVYDDDFNKIEKKVKTKQIELEYSAWVAHEINAKDGHTIADNYGKRMDVSGGTELRVDKKKLEACLKAANWPSGSILEPLESFSVIDIQTVGDVYTGFNNYTGFVVMEAGE